MVPVFLLALIGLVPNDAAIEDRVQIIELQHVYDEQAQCIFHQMLFWERTYEGNLRVVAWRIWTAESPTPLREPVGRGFVLLWMDGEQLRRVYAKGWKESYRLYENEDWLDFFFWANGRRGLTAHTHRDAYERRVQIDARNRMDDQ